VCEATWLAGTTIDRYSNIDDIAHLTEQIAQILVGHLEGHVANEEGLGGRVAGACASATIATVDGLSGAVELHGEAAALEDLLVGGLNRLGGILLVLELDIAEAVSTLALSFR
jgi:hypothetical protein